MKTKIIVILGLTFLMIGLIYNQNYSQNFNPIVKADQSIIDSSPIVIKQNKNLNSNLNSNPNLDSNLNYPGYFIYQSNVDYNNPGTYQITYQDIKSSQQITKDVIVLANSAKDYYYWQLQYSTESATFQTTAVRTLVIDERRSAVVYKVVKIGATPGIGSVYVEIFENGQRITGYLVINTAGLEITDCRYDNEKIVILGTRFWTTPEIEQIFLHVYDLKNKKSVQAEWGGSKRDHGLSLAISSQYYLIGGKTNSNDGIFKGTRKDYDGFILRVNRSDLTIDGVMTNSFTGDDGINHLYYLDGQLLGLILQGVNKIIVQKQDLFFDSHQIREFSFTKEVRITSEQVFDGQLYLGLKVYDYQTQGYVDQIRILKPELSWETVTDITKPGYLVVAFSYYQDFLTCLYQSSTQDQQLAFVCYQDKKIFYQTEIATPQSVAIGMLSSRGMGIVTYNYKDQYFEAYKFDYLVIKKLPSKSVDESIAPDDYLIYINGQVQTHTDRSLIDFDDGIFGDYRVIYFFEDSFTFIIDHDLILNAQCGIKDQEEYDIGVILNSNGETYLNGSLIKTPYQINQPGTYHVELIGKDGNQATFSFEVKPLSITYTPQEHQENIEYSDQTDFDRFELESFDLVFSQSGTSYNPPTMVNWLYIIPVVASIFSGLIIIMKRG